MSTSLAPLLSNVSKNHSPSKDTKTLSSRRFSYLGIRNFFTNTSIEPNQPSPLSQRSHFSTSFHNQFGPSVIAHGAQIRHLTAAEQEWLQDESVQTYTTSSVDTPTPRFDWRLRSSSRLQKEKTLAGEDVEKHDPRRRTLHRIAPPQINVQKGEPFYEEICAYSDRYGASNPSA